MTKDDILEAAEDMGAVEFFEFALEHGLSLDEIEKRLFELYDAD